MDVKIVTINLWKCDGDYDRRIPFLATELRNLGAQVVACQECFSTADLATDTLRFLSNFLGMSYHFVPARRKARLFHGSWVDSFSGLGVLSSLPIVSGYGFDLPSTGLDGGRKAQQVGLSIEKNEFFLLTNLHLSHLTGAWELRLKQLKAVAAGLLGRKCTYRVLCGDFNAPLKSPEIDFVMGEMKGLDCYDLGNGQHNPILSYGTCLMEFKNRVDHIFVMPSNEIGSDGYPPFKESTVVLAKPEESSGLYPSDHIGLCTTLVVTRL